MREQTGPEQAQLQAEGERALDNNRESGNELHEGEGTSSRDDAGSQIRDQS